LLFPSRDYGSTSREKMLALSSTPYMVSRSMDDDIVEEDDLYVGLDVDDVTTRPLQKFLTRVCCYTFGALLLIGTVVTLIVLLVDVKILEHGSNDPDSDTDTVSAANLFAKTDSDAKSDGKSSLIFM
jgi:hypothetical protein